MKLIKFNSNDAIEITFLEPVEKYIYYIYEHQETGKGLITELFCRRQSCPRCNYIKRQKEKEEQ